jgi:predicted enzyme related to lactoylglutathione lyase
MSERTHYPQGVPCWVDTPQRDPQAALRFYRDLFGWQFIGPGPMPGEPPGKYFVAQLRGRDVAGVCSYLGTLPQAFWNTYVAVESADRTVAKVKDAGGTIIAEPFDALPAGRVAVLQDPAGATFCAWEARERHGAGRVNEPSAWAMSSLMTRDPERSKAFYDAVFGWQPETFDAGTLQISLLRLPGYVGGEPKQPVPRDVVAVMVPMTGDAFPKDLPSHWSVDFWIDDVDAATAKAAALGASVLMPPHDTPGFRSSSISDPQGAIFTLSQLIY